MRVHGVADDVRVEADEDGWHLVVETNVGDFNFRIHAVAEKLSADVDATIGAWLREGRRAAATYVPRITLDDLDAYPPGDPKRITLEREMEKR